MLAHSDEPFDLEAELQIRDRIVLTRRARVRDCWVERFELPSELDRGSSLAGALDARHVTTAADFHDFEFGGGGLRHDVRGFTFTLARRDGRVVAHDDLGFGEQRLVGSFHCLACNLAVLFADELPTGQCERRLAACLAALGDRPVFLACRDPAPLQHLAPAPPIACTPRHGSCAGRTRLSAATTALPPSTFHPSEDRRERARRPPRRP